jgi:hypothetical protein
MRWLKRHPTLSAPAATFLIMAAALELFIDPGRFFVSVFVSGLFLVPFALTYVFAAFLDPKTYLKSKPPE